MTDDLNTSVRVEPFGAHEHVRVWVRGQLVGTLITRPGDGERLKNALLGAKYFGTGRTVDGPITAVELVEWRVLATGWLEAEEIVTSPVGVVGRIVLRLLDEVHRLKATFVSRPVAELSWLEKDFHVLYRAALAACKTTLLPGEGDATLEDLRRQLDRLAPAFEECEVVRRMARQTRERD